MVKTVRILGTHGVPAAYGGFETAAQHVAQHLVAHGWRVIVYCQLPGRGPVTTDTWQGIERVNVPIPTEGWLGTSRFDLVTVRHATREAARSGELCLTFGYNTAIFNVWQRVRGVVNVINMDGIEWSRARWGPLRQAILWTNDRIACVVGNHLIADHPEIKTYLLGHARASKVETITYGGPTVLDAPESPVRELGLTPGRYVSLIARPIPENSLLEIIEGFSARERGVRLAVLGDIGEQDPYHRALRAAASDEVSFLGAVYEPEKVQALRFHSLAYVHGHTVGGTNPSLVEALGAGNPVLAHDNPYNRWTAGEAGLWFRSAADVDEQVSTLLGDEDLRARLSAAARARHAAEFTWEHVAGQYEDLLERARQGSPTRSRRPRSEVSA